MEIQKVKLSLLHPDPDNARIHEGRNLGAVKDSLVSYSQYAPLVVNRNGMIVVVGNCRFKCMQMLGWSECDCILLDLTPEQVRRLSIIDNRSAELSDWDKERLKEVIGDLDVYGIDIGQLGFTELELRHVFGIGTERDEGTRTGKSGERFTCPRCGHHWEEFEAELGQM